VASLGGCSYSRSGILDPIRALKSPHKSVVSWGCRVSSTVSICVVAWSSVILRFVRDVVGGIYTFTIFILELLGRMILVCRLYSLPDEDSIYSGFRTYVAIPPRVPSGLRCSTNVNPSSMGAAVPADIHVSCKHNMSKFSCSSRSSILM
jgi:hypothetical protein